MPKFLAGWDVDYLPEVRLRHGYARASSVPGASVLSSLARRRHFRSLARYWRKHAASPASPTSPESPA